MLLTSCLEFSCFRHEMLWKLLFAHIQIPRGRLEAMEEDRQSCRLSVGLTSCTSLAKADPTPAPVRCPTCGQCVSTLSPQPGFIPQGDWLASWWQVNYLSTISTSGRAAEHSYWKLTFSPHLQSVSYCTILQVLTECLGSVKIVSYMTSLTNVPILKWRTYNRGLLTITFA